ncbi:MAG: TonB family protein [Spirochaetaceae bacterium]|nr:MAG: TonB family protein [Spirochaetaceae bacterium]
MVAARRRDTVDRRRMRQAVVTALLLHLCLFLVIEFVPSADEAGQGGDDRLTVVMEPPGAARQSAAGSAVSGTRDGNADTEQISAEREVSAAKDNGEQTVVEPADNSLDSEDTEAAEEPATAADSEDQVAESESEGDERAPIGGAAAPRDSAVAGDGPAAGPLTNGADVDALVADLYRRLQDQLIYPMAARRRNVEGVVTVRIQVESDGSLGSHEVAGSSGHSMLDRAALDSLERVFPISHQAGRPLLITVRIEYSLT